MSDRKLLVVVDASSVRSGGGLQIASNLVNELARARTKSEEVTFLVPVERKTDYRVEEGVEVRYVKTASIASRVIFEVWVRFFLLRLRSEHPRVAVYTVFGAGLPRIAGISSITNTAYPIICYNDSEYWHYIPTLSALRQKILNSMRRKRLASQDLVTCETFVMEERLRRHLQPVPPITVIAPSVTNHVREGFLRAKYTGAEPFRVILPSGFSRHKNLWRLPEVAAECTKSAGMKLRFLLTGNEEAYLDSLLPSERITYQKYADMFLFVGLLPPHSIGKLYEDAHVLLSLSDLESFSNNYMEAWKAGIPLVVSDRDFSRQICDDSALYCDPHQPRSVCEVLSVVLSSSEKRAAMVKAGKKKLYLLPSHQQRAMLVFDLIRGQHIGPQ